MACTLQLYHTSILQSYPFDCSKCWARNRWIIHCGTIGIVRDAAVLQHIARSIEETTAGFAFATILCEPNWWAAGKFLVPCVEWYGRTSDSALPMRPAFSSLHYNSVWGGYWINNTLFLLCHVFLNRHGNPYLRLFILIYPDRPSLLIYCPCLSCHCTQPGFLFFNPFDWHYKSPRPMVF